LQFRSRRSGAAETREIELWPKELQGLRTSAGVLRETLAAVLKSS
jgi:hypothetical protein